MNLKGVTDAKGLRHIKTATTRRIAAKPPQSGTAHLDMYLLGKERQRLEQELAHLDDRRIRIGNRITGIVEEIARLRQVAEQVATDGVGAGAGTDPSRPSNGQAHRRWKTMPVEY